VANGGNVFQLQNNFVKLSKKFFDDPQGNKNLKDSYYKIAPGLKSLTAEDGVIYLLTSQIWKTTTAAPVEEALKQCGMTQEKRLGKTLPPLATNAVFIAS